MSIGRNNDESKYESRIDPTPISSCDVMRALWKSERTVKQTQPYPAIYVDSYPPGHPQCTQGCAMPGAVYSGARLFDRAKQACELDMVVNPVEMYQRGENHFTTREKYPALYREALLEEEVGYMVGHEVLPPKIT